MPGFFSARYPINEISEERKEKCMTLLGGLNQMRTKLPALVRKGGDIGDLAKTMQTKFVEIGL